MSNPYNPFEGLAIDGEGECQECETECLHDEVGRLHAEVERLKADLQWERKARGLCLIEINNLQSEGDQLRAAIADTQKTLEELLDLSSRFPSRGMNDVIAHIKAALAAIRARAASEPVSEAYKLERGPISGPSDGGPCDFVFHDGVACERRRDGHWHPEAGRLNPAATKGGE